MIFKGPTGLSPTVTVSVDGVPVDYMSIKRLTIELKEGMHNLAILEFAGLAPDLIHQYIERPILITMTTRERDPLSFYGYISHMEPFSLSKDGLVNQSPMQMTRAYCLGASYRMKSKESRIWENVTISEITTELAEKYLFSVSVPNDSYRFKRLAQTNQSDWEFLVQTSAVLGYRVLMNGTNIHIWDPYKALNHKVSYSNLYTIKGSYGDPSPQPGQILKFEGTIGVITPEGSRVYDTLHVLDAAGRVISISNNDILDESGLGTPVESTLQNTWNVNAESYEMGQRMLSGKMREKFPFKANVSVVGDPSLSPGGVVNVNKYDTKFDGFWYVSSVRHEITQNSLHSTISIMKDALGKTSVTPMIATTYKTSPTPALRSGSWVSSTEMIDVYA